MVAALWLSKLIASGDKFRCAIVAPAIVLDDAWLKQLGELEETRHLDIIPTHQYSKQRREALWAAKEGHIITVTPDTMMSFLQAQQNAKTLFVDHMIADEGHLYKSPRAKRSQYFRALAQHIPTLILTGTLLPNGPIDAWVPGSIASRGQGWFGKDFWRWRGKNFREQGYKWIALNGVTQRVTDELAKVAISVDLDHAESGVPEELYLRHRFEFGNTHKERLSTLLNERWIETQWGEMEFSEDDDSAYLHKLRQVSSGYIVNGDEIQVFDEARLKALGEVVSSVTGGVLVVTHYRAEVELIKGRFSGVEVLNGATPTNERQRIIDDFNDGKVRVLACHPAAMGMGIHLGRGDARTICWFSGGFDYAQRIQTNARMVRKGQRHVVSIIELYSSIGIDNALVAAMKRKGTTEADVLKSLRGKYV